MPQGAQGGIVRLSAYYRDAGGELVDPVTPLVDVLNPSAAIVLNDAVPSRDSLGIYYYDYAIDLSAPLGNWVARFSGTVDGGLVVGEEPFTVVAPGTVGVGAPWLIQPSELFTGLGVAAGDVEPKDQLQAEQAIAYASEAIRVYCDRNFASPLVTQTREYEYDGSQYLDIDDATAVTAVAFSYGTTLPDDNLTAEQFRARPHKGSVFTYLVLPTPRGLGSGEMGFLSNLDVLYSEGRFGTMPIIAKVTGTWGWPEVPGGVKQAAIITVKRFLTAPDDQYSSEAIDSYSRTRGVEASSEAIPRPAKELLAPYVRENL